MARASYVFDAFVYLHRTKNWGSKGDLSVRQHLIVEISQSDIREIMDVRMPPDTPVSNSMYTACG